ncbi:hypothetical protein CP556_08640 [Natrinema sp. CBA1119]|uniref:hypothetical protein n=1 Tax=Natrinema sp. CBA1119 TaxID=1608465 RepID=UPI000BF45753|nr:hypothetical protein [Natrinema sp. CBA1119]PGF16172.1 hypothetical protein CP556_08640 [Natrinema sp. CBA1119]
MSTKQRRVTLALKWHYLENLSPEEIRDRFEEEGIGSYARSTIRGYLNEDPADKVLEQIEQEHANTRLQIAEREERMYKRAREAESKSLKDEPIIRVVPKTDTVSTDRETAMRWPAWEIVDPDDDDWPDWAAERDVIIRFLEDETTSVMPGETYPLRSVDGSPRYTKEFDGLERDQPNLEGQAMARQEQSSHLQAKGEVLGVYKDRLEVEGSLETESTVGLDEDTKEIAREVLAERYSTEGDDVDE